MFGASQYALAYHPARRRPRQRPELTREATFLATRRLAPDFIATAALLLLLAASRLLGEMEPRTLGERMVDRAATLCETIAAFTLVRQDASGPFGSHILRRSEVSRVSCVAAASAPSRCRPRAGATP